jgi:D-arabinose 1-dehydrogenase-like Zn-dependent alcohol dehydrogenase
MAGEVQCQAQYEPYVEVEMSTVLTLGIVETPKPKIIDDTDVIVKVTGSTICGSDLHLYHGNCNCCHISNLMSLS